MADEAYDPLAHASQGARRLLDEARQRGYLVVPRAYHRDASKAALLACWEAWARHYGLSPVAVVLARVSSSLVVASMPRDLYVGIDLAALTVGIQEQIGRPLHEVSLHLHCPKTARGLDLLRLAEPASPLLVAKVAGNRSGGKAELAAHIVGDMLQDQRQPGKPALLNADGMPVPDPELWRRLAATSRVG